MSPVKKGVELQVMRVKINLLFAAFILTGDKPFVKNLSLSVTCDVSLYLYSIYGVIIPNKPGTPGYTSFQTEI